jgi:EAL domain-containing protein (putative c-di-GMP-specific phosphodiesterase class I)
MKDLRGLQNAVRHVADPLVRLRHVVEEALVLVPRADGATVELVGDDGWLTCVCCAGSVAGHVGTRLRVEGSLSGLAMSTGRVLWAEDTETDDRVDREATRRLGVRSLVCVPLRRHGRALGVLAISSSQVGVLDETDVAVLTTVAEFLSIVVDGVAELGTVASALLARGEWQPVHDASEIDRRGVSAFVANVLTPNLADDVAAYQRVRELIDHADVAVVYQPIVELATESKAGYEALTRFPDGRPPNEWFDEAHRVGLGIELELFALATILSSTPENLDGFLSLNVSPLVVATPGIHLCLAARPRGCRLLVELTEHDSIDDYQAIRAGIGQLRSVGIGVAIDDVGSGYASLRHVVDLQPDVIKIDRSLVSYIDKDPARHGLAVAFNQLAVSLGWTVVAEGIERPEELAVCREIGITYGQGYLLARPGRLPEQLGPRDSWVSWSEEIGHAADPL